MKSKELSRHVVQFLHSGKEYSLRGSEGTKEWNYDDHRRKYMCAQGDYTDGKKLRTGVQLCFWGEWEPQSRYSRTGFAAAPRYVHRPFLNLSAKIKDDGKIRQNTAPFVFSDAFYYRCCQQVRKTGSTLLSYLDAGSIVLFGSNVNGGFAIDTVFVVGDSRAYTDVPDPVELKGFVPELYPEIVGIGFGSDADPDAACRGGSCAVKSNRKQNGKALPLQYRCYSGATFANRVEDMYSFVPCRLAKDAEQNPRRLVISSRDIDFISDNQTQGFKYMRNEKEPGDAYAVWQKVRQLCKENGFLEGLRFYYE